MNRSRSVHCHAPRYNIFRLQWGRRLALFFIGLSRWDQLTALNRKRSGCPILSSNWLFLELSGVFSFSRGGRVLVSNVLTVHGHVHYAGLLHRGRLGLTQRLVVLVWGWYDAVRSRIVRRRQQLSRGFQKDSFVYLNFVCILHLIAQRSASQGLSRCRSCHCFREFLSFLVM